MGMVINQCYLRNNSNLGNCNVTLENNILHSAHHINGGKVNHNVIVSNSWYHYTNWNYCLADVNSTTISYNFILDGGGHFHEGSNCTVLNNCRGIGSWGDNPVILPEGTKWEDVFKAHKGVSIVSDYHLTDTWAKSTAPDLSKVGIYGGGTGFSDKALAPIPRIVSKEVAEQTDGSGKLEIKVTVKAQ